MRTKLSKSATFIHTNNAGLDTLLEEYMSKLEQKVVSQTQQLKTITDNASSCLFMVDTNGRPTFMNPSAQKITGYYFEDIRDKELYKILHTTHRNYQSNSSHVCSIVTALRDFVQIRDQEDIFIRKDGTAFPVSFSVAPFRQGGKAKGAVLEFQDITKRKELERQKDEFIGIASHELKTPVTSIKGYAQILQQRFGKEGNMKAVELLVKMEGQLNKLTTLISDLLDTTKIEQGKLQFHKSNFDFNELVDETIEEMQRVANKHKIIKQLDMSKKLYGDRDRIGQVITNFLTNSIKYSPEAHKIIIKTSLNKEYITFTVKDFGIGISKKNQLKIFDRFYRAGGAKQVTYAGLGLGLYISSEIIKRHAGEIGVKSERGKGATFYFTLPIKRK